MDAFVKDVIDTAIESYQETIGGKHGMFYVLPRLLPVDTRKELSQEDGIHMYVMASEMHRNSRGRASSWRTGIIISTLPID